MARTSQALSACLLLLLCLAGPVSASPQRPTPPTGLTASVGARSVELAWRGASVPARYAPVAIVVRRDGVRLATLAPSANAFSDSDVAPGERHAYTLQTVASRGRKHVTSAESAPAEIALPAYLVGAATRDITPSGVVNLGGFGLGDGSVVPEMIIGRGGTGAAAGEHIAARAMVIDDGHEAIAIADIETQGMFAAYQDGRYGLADIAAQVAKDTGLPADHILVAADHTHSGPDTIGVWGGPPPGYLAHIRDQTVAAIEAALRSRRLADVRAGHSDASDLVYNQSCSEALNQSKSPAYTGPEACATPGKDGMFRVVQATAPGHGVVVTFAAYAAHSTAGGGSGITGDWPQYLSDAMATKFGGVGLAMEGANGGTQPCRAACSFTKPTNPGYNIDDRKRAIVTNYMAHVVDSLKHVAPVRGPVAAAQGRIREVISGPAVLGLFTAGQHIGARLLRSHENPWVVGNTISTVTSALRAGSVLFAGTPGEGFPAIGDGIRAAVTGEQEVIQLGLSNDQLGYLISPARYVPVIAAEVAVNDNIIFNVSPTIGDHVMCSDIALALKAGVWGTSPATCAPYDAQDAIGDPVASVPAGGITLP